MDEAKKAMVGEALGRIPSGRCVLTAEFEDRRLGMLCSWVQQMCFEPPMVVVAVAKGRPIMPLISESRQFGLCQLPANDKVMIRKFARHMQLGDDPFLGFEMVAGQRSNLPILKNALAHLECELSCHMDVEGDHDLFVGIVRAGHSQDGEPYVHVRDHGFHY